MIFFFLVSILVLVAVLSAFYAGVYGAVSTLSCAAIAGGYYKFVRRRGPRITTSLGMFGMSFSAISSLLGVVGVSQWFPAMQIPLIFNERRDNVSKEWDVATIQESVFYLIGSL